VLHIHDSNINELDANYTNVESRLITVTKYAIGEIPEDQETLNNSFRIIQDHDTRLGSENLLAAITMLKKQLNEIHTALMDLLIHDTPIQSLHPRRDKNSAVFSLSSTLQTPTATISDSSAFIGLYTDAFLERPSERMGLITTSIQLPPPPQFHASELVLLSNSMSSRQFTWIAIYSWSW
jgi:hypothetical protein